MNIDRFCDIMNNEFTNDRLKLDEELERTINSDIEIETKVTKIKDLLTKITINEASNVKFNSMINKQKND